jgi:DNA-binding MarR family transcriptional regulator
VDEIDLAEELRSAIGQLVRAGRRADTMAPGEAAVLGHLDRSGPQTTADLAARRRVTHQSVAKAVKELLREQHVRAEAHPTDGRKLLLHITPAGRDRLAQERRRRADWLSTAIRETLSPAEREELEACVPLLLRLSTYNQ